MKKILCTVLTVLLTLCFSLNIFAISPTPQQLDDLNKYSIFTGDADGNLRLEENITRAEAAKMICSLLLIIPEKDLKCSFPDVASGHWAEGWIETAKLLGIVSGDENGNFRPFDPVTNEEYIKMLIVALGYNPMAEARGGFPAGYTVIANNNGITKDMQFEVGNSAKRGDVAIMTHRALDVPVMVQTRFGSNVEYSVLDGKNGQEKRTLRLELDPDYKYPDEEKQEPANTADFEKSAYTYEDVTISNLSVKNKEYRFNDKNKSNKRTYVITSSAYVHLSKNTLALSEIENGMQARLLCTEEDDNGIVKVLGVELFNNN